MEIIAAGKIIELIFSYHAITRFIDYRDRPTYNKTSMIKESILINNPRTCSTGRNT